MFPDKKYKLIYVDPPWQWTKKLENRGKARAVEKEYSTMTTQDICNLPVSSISEDNSVLFLWVTGPKIKDGLAVIEAWGFDYKAFGFVWIKKNKITRSNFWGMGFYTRANAEFCLIGIKGRGLSRASASVHQIIESPIERHSQKPAEARKRIEILYGDVSRIELFARQQVDGWDCWGNEVNWTHNQG